MTNNGDGEGAVTWIFAAGLAVVGVLLVLSMSELTPVGIVLLLGDLFMVAKMIGGENEN